MSGNGSDSDCSLSDWELVQEKDINEELVSSSVDEPPLTDSQIEMKVIKDTGGDEEASDLDPAISPVTLTPDSGDPLNSGGCVAESVTEIIATVPPTVTFVAASEKESTPEKEEGQGLDLSRSEHSDLDVNEVKAVGDETEDSDVEVMPDPDDNPESEMKKEADTLPVLEQSDDLQESGPGDLERSRADLEKSSTDLEKSSTDLEKSSTDLEKSSTDLEKSSSDLEKSSTDLRKSSTGLTKSSTDLEKSSSDLEKSSTDLEKSRTGEPEMDLECSTSGDLQKSSAANLEMSVSEDLQKSSSSDLQSSSPGDLDMSRSSDDHVTDDEDDDKEEEDDILVIPEVKLADPKPVGPVRQESSSSDEDFVKIDKENSTERDAMKRSGSSVSSRFSFIQRRSDDESLPESDISLNDDSDLSAQDPGFTFIDPVRIRQYKHDPNTRMNTVLSLILGAVLALGVGIGIGHAFGSSREFHHHTSIHEGNADQIRNLHDNLRTCTQKRENMESRIYQYHQDKLNGILKELQERVTHLERENRHLKNIVDIKTKYMEQVMVENKDLKSKVDDVHANVSNLTQSMKEMKSENLLLEKEKLNERAELSQANAKLLSMIAELEGNTSELKQEHIRAKESRWAVEIEKNSEISNLQGRMIDLGTELENFQTREKTLLDEQENLNVQLTNARQALDQLSKDKQHAEHDTSASMKDLKTRLNNLLGENIDLRSEVAKLRYRQHPANPDQVTQFKVKVNTLNREKEELQLAVSRSRYAKQPTVEKGEQKEDDNVLMQKKIKEFVNTIMTEEGRNDVWKRLFVAEGMSGNENDKEKGQEAFMDCMKLVFSHINMTEFSRVFNDSKSVNVTQGFIDVVAYVCNATQNVKLKSFLHEQFDTFQQFMRSQEFKEFFKYFENGYGNVHEAFFSSWKKFTNYTKSDHFQKHMNRTKEMFSHMRETVDKTISKVQNFSSSDHVKEYINKTKETMSKLSVQIKETWTRLKNISAGLYKSHEPTVRKVHDDVTNTLFEFGKTIKDRFGKLRKDFERHKDNFKKGHKLWKKEKGHKHREHREKEGWEKKAKDGIKKNEEKNKKFTCHKMEKRLGKLKNTVESMSKRRWYKFDDSDREEFIEDLEKFVKNYYQYGIGCVDVHGVAWVDCQLEWWRASQVGVLEADVCSNCDSCLQRWQVKVMKKYLKKKNEYSKTFETPEEFKADPDTPEVPPEPESFEKPEEGKEEKDNSTLIDPFDENERPSKNWFLKRAEDREDHRHDATWYFRRMENREDKRHDTKWLFSRAEDRAKQQKRNTEARGEGTFGCTKRRGKKKNRFAKEEKVKHNGFGGPSLFHDFDNMFYNNGKDELHNDDDLNDPLFWRGY